MSDRTDAMVWASFVGDALALGAHWEYDPNRLADAHGRVTDYLEPLDTSYHMGKKAGGFTHYGDQELVLLTSLAKCGKFDPMDFSEAWRGLFDQYQGYLDGATKSTLDNLSRGLSPLEAGSPSNDLAGAARMAPLFAAYETRREDLVQAAADQARMTHNNPQILASAEFFALAGFYILEGQAPDRAMKKAALRNSAGEEMLKLVQAGLDAVKEPSVEAIGEFGRSCHMPDALPSVVQLVAKHQDNLEACLVECVMAGGDNAARAMACGMLLGAHLGMKAIPKRWLNGLLAKDAIRRALQTLSG